MSSDHLLAAWLSRTKASLSASSLVKISLDYVIRLIHAYPAENPQVKQSIRLGLDHLLYIPPQFVSTLVDAVLNASSNPPTKPNSSTFTPPLPSPTSVASSDTSCEASTHPEASSDPSFPRFSPRDTFLVDQLLHPAVTSLDMSLVSWVYRTHLLLHLDQMTHLSSLTLAFTNPPWSSYLSLAQSQTAIRGMANIRELCVAGSADDAMLEQVCQHCPLLTRLDVADSKAVTDISLQALSLLNNLSILDVSGTAVTDQRLVTFLQEKTGMTSLGSWSNFSFFLNCQDPPIRNLTEAKADYLHQCELQKFVKTCPNLVKLSLSGLENVAKLTVLGSLEKLRILEISGVDLRKSKLGLALLALSGNIRVLHLENATGMDTQDVRTIGTHCHKLEELHLLSCTISRSIYDSIQLPTSNTFSLKHKAKLFNKLKYLRICSNISPSQFLLLTGHASHLEKLHTGASCWVTPRLLSRLVLLNPLPCLASLRMDNTNQLCVKTLFFLLSTMTSLTDIYGAEAWEGLSVSACDQLNAVFKKYDLPHRLITFPSANTQSH